MSDKNTELFLPDRVENVIREISAEEGLENIRIDLSRGAAVGGNFLGQIIKVDVSGTKNGSDQSLYLIAKLSPKFNIDESVNKVYNKEISAYTKVLPSLYNCQNYAIPDEDKFKFVKYYNGGDEVEQEFVVMESLYADGFVSFDKKKTFDRDDLSLVIKNLAAFHAMSFVLQRRNPKLFDELLNLISYQFSYDTISDSDIELGKNKFVAIIEDPHHREKLVAFLENTRKTSRNFLSVETAAPYNVITHGDCWTGNFLFKYKENKLIDMRILDWQTMGYASPITDVAYMIFCCTDEELRAEHFLPMLDFYYETMGLHIAKMGGNISECFPETVYREHIKLFMPLGLIIAPIVLPMLLSNEDYTPSYEEHGDSAWFMVPFSEPCKKRLIGVVKDFVLHEYI